MPWIAAMIRHVIIANDIPWLEHGVSLAAVGYRVAAGVEDAMRPLRPVPNAARHQTAMDVTLGLPCHDCGKDFQIGLVQEVSCLLQAADLPGWFDPTDLGHHVRTIDHPDPGEQSADLLPACGAEVGLLEADG